MPSQQVLAWQQQQGGRLQGSLGLGELMGLELGLDKQVTTRRDRECRLAELGSEEAGPLHAGQEGEEEMTGPWVEVVGDGGAGVVGWFSGALRKEARREERTRLGFLSVAIAILTYFCFQNFGCMIRS